MEAEAVTGTTEETQQESRPEAPGDGAGKEPAPWDSLYRPRMRPPARRRPNRPPSASGAAT